MTVPCSGKRYPCATSGTPPPLYVHLREQSSLRWWWSLPLPLPRGGPGGETENLWDLCGKENENLWRC